MLFNKELFGIIHRIPIIAHTSAIMMCLEENLLSSFTTEAPPFYN